jgi:antitoxin component YwqK of YwqJK toxin-antitoxin module
MRTLLFFFLLALCLPAGAQDDTVNQTDSRGRKTGYWITRDPQGNKVYEGFFRDGQPYGKFLRFHPNGRVRAEMNYLPGGRVDTRLFDDKGRPVAAGTYADKLKDGPWTFYSEGNIPLYQINYDKGLLEGEALRYHPDGTLVEETHWKDNLMEGWQIIYYPGKKPQARISYHNGLMDGPYELYFPDGSGDWIYHHPDGSVDFILKYSLGKLLNPDQLDARQKAVFDQYEKNRLILKDPQDFMKNPEELLRR